jgi:hypothetical protein
MRHLPAHVREKLEQKMDREERMAPEEVAAQRVSQSVTQSVSRSMRRGGLARGGFDSLVGKGGNREGLIDWVRWQTDVSTDRFGWSID